MVFARVLKNKTKATKKKERELICTKCAGFEGKRRIHKYKVTLALLDLTSYQVLFSHFPGRKYHLSKWHRIVMRLFN